MISKSPSMLLSEFVEKEWPKSESKSRRRPQMVLVKHLHVCLGRPPIVDDLTEENRSGLESYMLANGFAGRSAAVQSTHFRGIWRAALRAGLILSTPPGLPRVNNQRRAFGPVILPDDPTLLEVVRYVDGIETGAYYGPSVPWLEEMLGRGAMVADLNAESLEKLVVFLRDGSVSEKRIRIALHCLRRAWSHAYGVGLTKMMPPARGTHFCRKPRKRRVYQVGLRTPISEPPPERLTIESSLLDVALHMAHAKQTDVHPKTRAH